MKKIVRDHRTIGVELARSEIEVGNQPVSVVIYQTEPEGAPQVLLGNSGLVSVTPAEIEKYISNRLFQTMVQALYFGLESESVQELAAEVLKRSDQYIASFAQPEQVSAAQS